MRKMDWLYRLGYTFQGNLSQYLYAPLRTPTAIRLLELQPGRRMSPIQCELVQTSLQDSVRYEALSYCWGELHQTRQIACSGRSVPVTNNLYIALENLRYPHETRMLWVDAMCINQRDYVERNHQLGLMSRIYQQANQVVVSIGEMTEDSDMAINSIAQTKAPRDLFQGVSEEEFPSTVEVPGENSPAWWALRYFFRRPWFRRVWVIQEIANASKLDVFCGEQKLNWDDIVRAARCIKESSTFAATDTAFICEHICFMDECRRAVHNKPSKELSLLNLLYKSRQCASTDLRDKIYGLYPLIDANVGLPDPVYDKSIASVYKETAAYFLRSTGSLAVLSCAGVGKCTSNRALYLPSWVPDWSQDKAASLAMSFDSATPIISESSPIGCRTSLGDARGESVIDHWHDNAIPAILLKGR
jgi:hypothetical protein